MKTLIKLLCVIAVFITTNAFAGDSKAILNTNAQKVILEGITAKAQRSEKVEVVFTTDEHGRVNLAIAKTGSSELRKQIEKDFLNMKFDNLQPNNAYSITLNFKLV